MRQFELVCIEGCVEPRRYGPFRNYPDLLAAARREWERRGDTDLLLAAWVDDDGRVTLSSFSTGELESDNKLPK